MQTITPILDAIAHYVKEQEMSINDFTILSGVSGTTYRNSVINRKSTPLLGNLQAMAYTAGHTLTLNDIPLDFGRARAALWQAYHEQGLTYVKLADKANVNRETCRRILTAGGEKNHLKHFIKVAEALGFTVNFRRRAL